MQKIQQTSVIRGEMIIITHPVDDPPFLERQKYLLVAEVGFSAFSKLRGASLTFICLIFFYFIAFVFEWQMN